MKRSLSMPGKGPKPEAYDERVLGLGGFVERLRREEEMRQRLPQRISMEELVQRVGGHFYLEPERLWKRSTAEAVAKARGVVSYVAVANIGYKGIEVGAVFGWTRSGTSKAVERGRRMSRETPGLIEAILGADPERFSRVQTAEMP